MTSSDDTAVVSSLLRFLFNLSLDGFDEKNMSMRPPPYDFFVSAAATGATAADDVGSLGPSFGVGVVFDDDDGGGDKGFDDASVRGLERFVSRSLVVEVVAMLLS